MKPVPYYVHATLLGVCALLVGSQLRFWVSSATNQGIIAFTDFPHHYRIGKMLTSGRAAEIYETTSTVEQQASDCGRGLIPMTSELAEQVPYLHPAFEAPLFALLSFFPMSKAVFLWLAINIIVGIGIYRLILPHVPTLSTMRPLIPVALLFAFAYVPRAALHGQDSTILLLVMCGAFSFIATGDLFNAGVILGLGSFRFQHTLYMIALFLAWKAWKLAAGYFVSGFGCALASLAVTGLQGQIQYVKLLSRASHWTVRNGMTNLRGVFAFLGISDAYTPILLLCFLAIAALLGRKLSRRDQFLFAIVAMTLGSFYLFFYDLAVLFLPLVMLLEDALAEHRISLSWFCLAVLSAPICISVLLHVDQGQAMTAVILGFFIVLAATSRRAVQEDACGLRSQ